MARGQPTKYKKRYCKDIIAFFDVPAIKTIEVTIEYKNGTIKTEEKEIANDLPFFEQFAHEIGVHVDTLHEWKKVHPEFSEAYKKAKKMQEHNWKVCSLKGLYNPAFTIFFGKNIYKWTDKQEVEHKGDLTINTVKFADGGNDTE